MTATLSSLKGKAGHYCCNELTINKSAYVLTDVSPATLSARVGEWRMCLDGSGDKGTLPHSGGKV